jgi:hypothetical protein
MTHAIAFSPRDHQVLPRRARKFIGTLVTIVFVIIYALIAMALAQSRLIQGAPGALQALYYVVLGLAWILPLMPLIKWMERP